MSSGLYLCDAIRVGELRCRVHRGALVIIVDIVQRYLWYWPPTCCQIRAKTRECYAIGRSLPCAMVQWTVRYEIWQLHGWICSGLHPCCFLVQPAMQTTTLMDDLCSLLRCTVFFYLTVLLSSKEKSTKQSLLLVTLSYVTVYLV